MSVCKNEAGTSLPITVMEGVTVNVLLSDRYGFLVTTKEVARVCGVGKVAVRKAKQRHKDELIEGTHFVIGSAKDYDEDSQDHSLLWTRIGLIRLRFFIQKGESKLFRDWLEAIICDIDQKDGQNELDTTGKRALRSDNDLTPTRMNRILADICKIEDAELRNRLANEIMGGN